MKGDNIFGIPLFTESGETNPSLIKRIRSDFGNADEQLTKED
jgi:hypothetical protein